MARRSNKTAHVLNLLAGHDTQNTSDESAAVKETEAPAADKASAAPAPAGSEAAAGSAAPSTPAANTETAAPPSPAPAQNISVIDTTGTDPLAELIQQKLSDEFGESAAQDTIKAEEADSSKSDIEAAAEPEQMETAASDTSLDMEPEEVPAADTVSAVEAPTADAAPAVEVPTADAAPAVEASDAEVSAADAVPDAEVSAAAGMEAADSASIPSKATVSADVPSTDLPDAEAVQAEASAPVTEPVPAAETAADKSSEEDAFSFPKRDETSSSDTISVPGPGPGPDAVPVPSPESVPGPGHTVPKTEPVKEQEPEPDFVYLNVMEAIVKDKIIYFMRQFDVCTCERCKADTVALVMNGLLPKYIVTTPAAVDPLVSYYTNRLISDVTVEATKACMVVKENPRH